MKPIDAIFLTLCTVLFFGSLSACSHSQVIALKTVESNPLAFHKRYLNVRGILRINTLFGSMLYVSEQDADAERMRGGLDLFITSDKVRQLERKYDERPTCVIVSGVFYKYHEGEIRLDTNSYIGMIRVATVRPCQGK